MLRQEQAKRMSLAEKVDTLQESLHEALTKIAEANGQHQRVRKYKPTFFWKIIAQSYIIVSTSCFPSDIPYFRICLFTNEAYSRSFCIQPRKAVCYFFFLPQNWFIARFCSVQRCIRDSGIQTVFNCFYTTDSAASFMKGYFCDGSVLDKQGVSVTTEHGRFHYKTFEIDDHRQPTK